MGQLYSSCMRGLGLPNPLINLDHETLSGRRSAGGDANAGDQTNGKSYSWDKKRADNFDSAQYIIENVIGGTEVGRMPGTIKGEQFMIRNCEGANIYLFDHINTLTIDDCKDCKIFVGPTKGSIFLRDSSNCTLVAACGQFRTRDCLKINSFLCCSTQPIIEATANAKFGCFQYFYPELEAQFEDAELSPYNNLWWNIHDFTPNVAGEGKNWSLLGECYKVQDYLPLAENFDLKTVEVSNSKSVVPQTIGNRTREHQDETTLVLVFKDDLQEDRAKQILRLMINSEQQIELVKTRKLSLDITDVERLFTSTAIRKYAANGPLIGLQISGPNCLEKAKAQAIKVIHETGGNAGCIHCSQNDQEARLEISNLFNFAEMQLGL